MAFSDGPDGRAKRIVILGSTGSIGRQTLDVCRMHPDKLQVVGLSCHSHIRLMEEQAQEFQVQASAVGAEEALSLLERDDVDVVVNALVGAAGLAASLKTLESGRVLALANKESLVVGGDLIMPMAQEPGTLIMPLAHAADACCPTWGQPAEFRPEGALMPIDSEHGAIYQCLVGEDAAQVSRLWVTASGGPFRGKSQEELAHVTAADALAHPTWNMGRKITIDSSTLMNKGLEVIEAHHLFQMPYDRIEVLVQPQSAIHSMVEFTDGSVKAHLGATDMRIPIQYALSWPDRWPSPVEAVDFRTMGSLDLAAPDLERFPCLSLAIQAGTRGGTLPCAMNAANEVAVAAFLEGSCGFLDIPACVQQVMESHDTTPVQSFEQLVEVDEDSRRRAEAFLRAKR